MAERKRSNKLKRFKVARAVVSLNANVNAENYDHPTIYLYGPTWEDGSRGKTLLKVKFQRHRLPFSGGYRDALSPNDKPDRRFDVGAPWSRCYSARTDEGPSLDWGFEEWAKRTIGILRAIRAAVSDHNIGAVTECELGQWVDALEKLGVPTAIEFWRRGNQEPLQAYEIDPEDKGRAAKLYRAEEERAQQ